MGDGSDAADGIVTGDSSLVAERVEAPGRTEGAERIGSRMAGSHCATSAGPSAASASCMTLGVVIGWLLIRADLAPSGGGLAMGLIAGGVFLIKQAVRSDS